MIVVETRNDLLDLLPQNMIIAELGVFKAQFSDIILEKCLPKELHLIDIWNGRTGSGDKDGLNGVRVQDMFVVYKDLVNKFSNNPIVKLHRMTTLDGLKQFSDNYFDFIYIDACHKYKSCYRDLKMSFVKSKKYIGGHDYCKGSGVEAAVNQFCEENKLEISHITRDGCPSFLIEKK